MEPVPEEYLSRIAILYGTSELHSARDSHSFTCELCQLVKSRRTPICIVDIPGYVDIDMTMINYDIVRKVNESWEKKKIKQRCKLDCVEVGDNWKNFHWPNKPLCSKKIRRMSSIFEDPPKKVTFKKINKSKL